MTGIELYSTTAANNNSAVPNGWPEGMAPSGVNDAARQMMAAIRTWYETAEWINLGYTHTYGSGTTFTIASTDVTTIYSVGRRIKAVGSSTGTIYGIISATAFSTNTTVTVVWDSGSLSNETLTVSIGILNPLTFSLPPYTDTFPVVCGSSDKTKKVRFEADGITTATTRVITVPDSNLTLPYAGQLVGTATNDSASAGNVGQIIESEVLVGSAVSMTTAIAANITSISLTAGDWDVWGNVAGTLGSGTSITAFYAAIHTVSATLPTIPNKGAYVGVVNSAASVNLVPIHPVGTMRISVASTTTIYLVAQVSFTVSTLGVYGYLGARRRR